MFCAIARSSQSANACRSFWVAEKSDGVRVLLFVQTDQAGGQMVYLVNLFFVLWHAVSLKICVVHRSTATTRIGSLVGYTFHTTKIHECRSRTLLLTGSSSLTSILAPSKFVKPPFFAPSRTLTARATCAGDSALSGFRLPRGGRPARHVEADRQAILGPYFANCARFLLRSRPWLTCVLCVAAPASVDVQTLPADDARPPPHGPQSTF